MTCEIEGCDGPMVARGWCGKHYRRWSVSGDPRVSRWERWTPAEDAILLSLPLAPRSRCVRPGYLTDAAHSMNRSRGAARLHLWRLRNARARAAVEAAV